MVMKFSLVGNQMTKQDDEAEFVKVIQQIVDMMNDCITNKTSEEMELTLGEENLGDSLIITMQYNKVKKTKSGKNKELLN